MFGRVACGVPWVAVYGVLKSRGEGKGHYRATSWVVPGRYLQPCFVMLQWPLCTATANEVLSATFPPSAYFIVRHAVQNVLYIRL